MKKQFAPLWFLPAVFLLSLVLLPGSFANVAHAGELTLLGPVKCERTKGQKNAYTYRFSSIAEQNGLVQGTLLIWNGRPDWKHQVTSAVIWLNGKKWRSRTSSIPASMYCKYP